jgi:hypothetical protein
LALSVPETPFEYEYLLFRYEHKVLQHRSDPMHLG